MDDNEIVKIQRIFAGATKDSKPIVSGGAGPAGAVGPVGPKGSPGPTGVPEVTTITVNYGGLSKALPRVETVRGGAFVDKTSQIFTTRLGVVLSTQPTVKIVPNKVKK